MNCQLNIFHRQGVPKKDEVRSQKSEGSRSEKLKDLCRGNESLYEAMQNFLLLNPKSQIPQLGETDSLIQKGNVAVANGRKLEARVDFETAARIEISRLNNENTRKCLLLADQVTESDTARRYPATLLENLDKVMEISRSYYGLVDLRSQSDFQYTPSTRRDGILVKPLAK
jgi:hypothetical protein